MNNLLHEMDCAASSFLQTGADTEERPARSGIKKMAEYAAKENGIQVAFRDGKSSGTKNMIQAAKEKELEIHVFDIHAVQPEQNRKIADA